MKKFDQIINSYITEQDQQQGDNISTSIEQLKANINANPNLTPELKQKFFEDLDKLSQEVSAKQKQVPQQQQQAQQQSPYQTMAPKSVSVPQTSTTMTQ